MGDLVASLCNRRYTERTVGYVESHDQCLVGDQTLGAFSHWILLWVGASRCMRYLQWLSNFQVEKIGQTDGA